MFSLTYDLKNDGDTLEDFWLMVLVTTDDTNDSFVDLFCLVGSKTHLSGLAPLVLSGTNTSI